MRKHQHSVTTLTKAAKTTHIQAIRKQRQDSEHQRVKNRANKISNTGKISISQPTQPTSSDINKHITLQNCRKVVNTRQQVCNKAPTNEHKDLDITKNMFNNVQTCTKYVQKCSNDFTQK